MASYTGKYGQREVSAEILLKDGRLFLMQGSVEAAIRKVGENRFEAIAPGNGAVTEFALVAGADGKAEYFQGGLRSARRIK
jgi:hypothetical protein